MEKTIKKYLQECAEPWAQKALKYAQKEKTSEEMVDSLADAVANGFDWAKTYEGYTFWHDIYFQLPATGISLYAMEKTVEQYLQECDKPWMEKALKYAKKGKWKNELVVSLSDALLRGFSWDKTEEGHTFWHNIFFDLVEAGE